jgi:hypothetical protein
MMAEEKLGGSYIRDPKTGELVRQAFTAEADIAPAPATALDEPVLTLPSDVAKKIKGEK